MPCNIARYSSYLNWGNRYRQEGGRQAEGARVPPPFVAVSLGERSQQDDDDTTHCRLFPSIVVVVCGLVLLLIIVISTLWDIVRQQYTPQDRARHNKGGVCVVCLSNSQPYCPFIASSCRESSCVWSFRHPSSKFGSERHQPTSSIVHDNTFEWLDSLNSEDRDYWKGEIRGHQHPFSTNSKHPHCGLWIPQPPSFVPSDCVVSITSLHFSMGIMKRLAKNCFLQCLVVFSFPHPCCFVSPSVFHCHFASSVSLEGF